MKLSRASLLIGFFTVLFFSSVLTGFLLFGQSIRLDEAQSIWIATKPLDTILKLTSQDVHVPLYNTLLHFWLQIFGSSITVARSLSYLFFLLTLPLLYVLGKRASNQKVALVTILFFSVSPFILWYTSEARMYTLFTFVTALNHICFLNFVKSEGRSGKTGYFFSLLLGIYTHYFFLLLIVTQGVFILARSITLYTRKNKTERSLGGYLSDQKGFLLRFVFMMVAVGICFAPWIYYVIQSGGVSNTQPLIPPPTSYNIIQTFVNFLFGFQPNGIQSILISLWPLLIVILFFVFTQRKNVPISFIEYFVMATFFPIALAFLVSFFKPIFLTRYLIFVTPTLFFIISWILLNYSRRISTYVISSIIFIMLGFMIYQNISSSVPVKENYQGVAQYLEHNATPEDIIAISAPFTIYPIEYTYRGSTRLVTIPEWNRYSSGGIPPFSIPELQGQLKGFGTQYSRLFVVLSYDQGYEKTIRKYLDGHYQLLDKKTFSDGLETRVYKLRYEV